MTNLVTHKFPLSATYAGVTNPSLAKGIPFQEYTGYTDTPLAKPGGGEGERQRTGAGSLHFPPQMQPTGRSRR